jgi:XTP/dITP diphosphohydrolase
VTDLLLATANRGKQREFSRLLSGIPGRIVFPQDIGLEMDVPEPHHTYAENASAKAEAYCRASGLLSVADDSGIEVAALGWGPGVRSARFANGSLRHADALLDALGDAEDRRARMVCFLAVAHPELSGGATSDVFSGVVEGRVARARRGDNGFGYDPIFELPSGLTTAEMPEEEKDAISHRGRAVEAAMPRLRELLRDSSGNGGADTMAAPEEGP